MPPLTLAKTLRAHAPAPSKGAAGGPKKSEAAADAVPSSSAVPSLHFGQLVLKPGGKGKNAHPQPQQQQNNNNNNNNNSSSTQVPREARFVRFQNVPGNTTIDALRSIAEQFGSVRWVERCTPVKTVAPLRKYTAVLSFDQVNSAKQATKELAGAEWSALGHEVSSNDAVQVDGPVDADTLFAEKWLANDPSKGNALHDDLHPMGVCTFFVKLNWCCFGQRCRYWHPGGGDRGAVPVTPPSYPRRPGAQPCTHYIRTGHCSYGPGCKFDHPEREDAKEEEEDQEDQEDQEEEEMLCKSCAKAVQTLPAQKGKASPDCSEGEGGDFDVATNDGKTNDGKTASLDTAKISGGRLPFFASLINHSQVVAAPEKKDCTRRATHDSVDSLFGDDDDDWQPLRVARGCVDSLPDTLDDVEMHAVEIALASAEYVLRCEEKKVDETAVKKTTPQKYHYQHAAMKWKYAVSYGSMPLYQQAAHAA